MPCAREGKNVFACTQRDRASDPLGHHAIRRTYCGKRDSELFDRSANKFALLAKPRWENNGDGRDAILSKDSQRQASQPTGASLRDRTLTLADRLREERVED